MMFTDTPGSSAILEHYLYGLWRNPALKALVKTDSIENMLLRENATKFMSMHLPWKEP